MRHVVLAAAVALLCLVTAGTALAQMQMGAETHTNLSTNVEVNETGTTLEQQVEHQEQRGVGVAEQLKEHIREKAKNASKEWHARIVEKVRERLHNAGERYIKARNEYKVTKEEYMKLKQHGKFNFGHAKRYCLAGGVYIEKWFDRIESMVLNSNMDNETKEAMLARIEDERSAFEEKLQAINESQTPEELRNAVKDLKEEWKSTRILVKATAMQVVIVKIENVINKADDLQLRLEERITETNDTKLAAILEDYAAKLDEAKAKLDEAKGILTNAETQKDINEARGLIIDAIHLLKDAFKDVREIVKELKVGQGRIFFGNQTGELFARGNGTAEFEGMGIIVVRGSGDLSVKPDTAIVTLVGFGNKSVEDGVAKVSGQGKAVIRGKDIKVKIEGEHITLFAKGYGTAYLEGNGTYRVKKLPKYNMTEETYTGSVTVEIGGEQ